MTVDPTSIASAASPPMAVFQAPRDGIRASRDASRPFGRHAQMALLMGVLWLLVAVAMNAAGEGAFGICFAAVAVLWVWIAAVESQDRRLPSATRKMHAQTRWHAAPSVS